MVTHDRGSLLSRRRQPGRTAVAFERPAMGSLARTGTQPVHRRNTTGRSPSDPPRGDGTSPMTHPATQRRRSGRRLRPLADRALGSDRRHPLRPCAGRRPATRARRSWSTRPGPTDGRSASDRWSSAWRRPGAGDLPPLRPGGPVAGPDGRRSGRGAGGRPGAGDRHPAGSAPRSSSCPRSRATSSAPLAHRDRWLRGRSETDQRGRLYRNFIATLADHPPGRRRRGTGRAPPRQHGRARLLGGLPALVERGHPVGRPGRRPGLVPAPSSGQRADPGPAVGRRPLREHRVRRRPRLRGPCSTGT